MAKVIVESGDVYNGEYELDLSFFTNRELHIIKKETGIRAGELYEAFDVADTDLLVVLAIIAIRRKTGETADSNALWELPAGKITLDVSGEDDASPPDEASIAPPETSGGDAASLSDSSVNGESSQEPSPPSASGNPG